jgi:hypothetical protein
VTCSTNGGNERYFPLLRGKVALWTEYTSCLIQLQSGSVCIVGQHRGICLSAFVGFSESILYGSWFKFDARLTDRLEVSGVE